MQDQARTGASERMPELDWLKGLAIVWVVCIHAEFGSGSLPFEAVIDRAVSVFVVLFGVTSELWWRREVGAESRGVARRWYRARLWRLMVPVWTVATLWWIAAFAIGRAQARRLDWTHVLASYVGFSPWVGISWFVTAILQLVLLFPLIRWVMDRTGIAWSLAISGLITVTSVLCMWDIVDAAKWMFDERHVAPPHWWYFWVFAPRFSWHVTVGIAIARLSAKPPGWRTAVAAAALFVAAAVMQEVVTTSPADPVGASLRRLALVHVADAPLTICLLALVRTLPARWWAARLLAWCGAASWGIYLGQMLVHEFVHMLGFAPERSANAIRLGYAALLLAGGAGLTLLGSALRSRVFGPASDVRPGEFAARSADPRRS